MALDRATVVRAALRLLDDVGLDGLSLRRIAAELNVQAPALYWHFENKQALLDEMATTMLADNLGDLSWQAAADDWRALAVEFAIGLRRMLLTYRDGAKLFSGTYLTDPALFAPMEVGLQVFAAAGFSLREAIDALATLYAYTIGFTIEEQAIFPRPGERDPRYDVDTRAARIDAERYPLARAAGAESLTRFDERFSRGVEMILTGIEQTRQR